MNNKLLRQALAIILLLSTHGVSADTVLITGANKGIGLEFTTQYLVRGWQVIATHRRDDLPETLRALQTRYENLRIEKVDITDREQVTALAASLTGVPIDDDDVTEKPLT